MRREKISGKGKKWPGNKKTQLYLFRIGEMGLFGIISIERNNMCKDLSQRFYANWIHYSISPCYPFILPTEPI